MLTAQLYFLQRLTALLMVPLVIGHLAVMIYAVQNGLSAEEILGRTKGSLGWGLFYGTFVLAASIHAAIGLRVVLHEVAGLSGLWLKLVSLMIAACLFWLGASAVVAVTVR